MRFRGEQVQRRGMILLMLSGVLGLYAPVNYAADTTMTQIPQARWYRYYQNGVPTLSGVITQEHVRYGYDALDRNMLVIRHVPPFAQSTYDRQKSQREKLDAQRQADRNLMLAHVSSMNAAAKRDQLIAEMQSRAEYLKKQTLDMQTELARDVAVAASYERRQTAVPAPVQKRMSEKRNQIEQIQQNLAALKKREDDTKSTYARTIARLEYLERNRGALNAPARTTP